MQIVELYLDEEKAFEAAFKDVERVDLVEGHLAELIDQSLSNAAKKMEIPFMEYLDALRTIRFYVDVEEYHTAIQLVIQLAEQLDKHAKVILERMVSDEELEIEEYLIYFSEYIVDWYELERIFKMQEDDNGWPDECLADLGNEPYIKFLKKKYGVMEVTDEECESDGDM